LSAGLECCLANRVAAAQSRRPTEATASTMMPRLATEPQCALVGAVRSGHLLAVETGIVGLADGLRRLRNSVFRVPEDVATTHDPRLVAFIERPETPELVRRVHSGFGRLFLTRLQNR
jgi:hypothetical protein